MRSIFYILAASWGALAVETPSNLGQTVTASPFLEKETTFLPISEETIVTSSEQQQITDPLKKETTFLPISEETIVTSSEQQQITDPLILKDTPIGIEQQESTNKETVQDNAQNVFSLSENPTIKLKEELIAEPNRATTTQTIDQKNLTQNLIEDVQLERKDASLEIALQRLEDQPKVALATGSQWSFLGGSINIKSFTDLSDLYSKILKETKTLTKKDTPKILEDFLVAMKSWDLLLLGKDSIRKELLSLFILDFSNLFIDHQPSFPVNNVVLKIKAHFCNVGMGTLKLWETRHKKFLDETGIQNVVVAMNTLNCGKSFTEEMDRVVEANKSIKKKIETNNHSYNGSYHQNKSSSYYSSRTSPIHKSLSLNNIPAEHKILSDRPDPGGPYEKFQKEKAAKEAMRSSRQNFMATRKKRTDNPDSFFSF